MSCNLAVTIATNSVLTPQTYNNITIVNDNIISSVNTELILILSNFNFVNGNILEQLVNILDKNPHIDGIYSDILHKGSIIINLAYNKMYSTKLPPQGPVIFKSKFQSMDNLLKTGFLLHIPHVLFYG